VQSALGIAVVDESTYALAERAPGFAKLFFGLDLGLYPSDEAPPGEARDQAARAVWAALPAGPVEVARSDPARTVGGVAARRQGRLHGLAWGLGLALLILAVGLWMVVLARLRADRGGRVGIWRTALVLVALVTFLVLPAAVASTVGLWVGLGAAAGKALLGLVLAAWLADWILVAVLYVRRRDDLGQIGALLVAAYGALAVALWMVASRGVEPGLGVAVVVAISWAGMGFALLLLAAAFWTRGRRILSVANLALIVLSVSLAVLAGLLLRPQTLAARTIADPSAYLGPAGWLSGCAPLPKAEPVEATVEVEKEVASEVERVVKETVIVEKEVVVTQVVEVEKEVTKLSADKSAEPTPTRAPEGAAATLPPTPAATPAPPAMRPSQPTASPPALATPSPSPEPPPPLLGQVAAETIYWMPEAVTDTEGQLLVEFPFPDVPSTWRMTVLASTVDGELGESELLLPVYP
jgi:hypothetical protein